MRSNATRVLAQGVGAVTRRPFGGGSYGTDLRVWDAKLPMHLPLPRAVGPYTVIRTTRRVQLSARVAIFGCYRYGAEWTDVCATADVDASGSIAGTNNTHGYVMPMSGLGSAATVCPAAFSVQIMNPEALQDTKGIVYMGTMNTSAKIGGRAESYDDYANKFIQFQNPRLTSAGKLALKGVQIDSYPLNMDAISTFTPLNHRDVRNAFTWTASMPEPAGWAPIVVCNPNQPHGPDLEFLVTTEWRVRFDLDNPASSGHTQHPTAPDSLWDRLTRSASSRGHNVRDISDTLSDVGSTVSSAANTYNVLRRALNATEPLIDL